MLQRCRNPNNPQYPDYGQRGIYVDERWNVFAQFLQDMGECPPGMTLERKDNSDGYRPGNVQWASYGEQANNKRSSVFLVHPITGERKTLAQWARSYGIDCHAFGKFYRRRPGMGGDVLLAVENSRRIKRS